MVMIFMMMIDDHDDDHDHEEKDDVDHDDLNHIISNHEGVDVKARHFLGHVL